MDCVFTSPALQDSQWGVLICRYVRVCVRVCVCVCVCVGGWVLSHLSLGLADCVHQRRLPSQVDG